MKLLTVKAGMTKAENYLYCITWNRYLGTFISPRWRVEYIRTDDTALLIQSIFK